MFSSLQTTYTFRFERVVCIMTGFYNTSQHVHVNVYDDTCWEVEGMVVAKQPGEKVAKPQTAVRHGVSTSVGMKPLDSLNLFHIPCPTGLWA